MKMRSGLCSGVAGVVLACLVGCPGWVKAAPPDLTKADLGGIDRRNTYNLGPTGLRGWIYIDHNGKGGQGLQTDESRQILVTHVGTNTPAYGVLQTNDVILGVGAGEGAAPLFTADARKSFGWAIGEAEKEANHGSLNLKRWRNGTISDVRITLQVMGSYSDTAPYNCPKSARILSNAFTVLEKEMLSGGWAGAISGLALLSTGDTNVLPKVQAYARSLSPANLHVEIPICGMVVWDWGYIDLFLCEYYLATGDTNVLHGINEYTVNLARGQSMFGTFGHGCSQKTPAGAWHGSVAPYGSLNQAGLIGNLGIVMGKKCGVKDPEIKPAIARAANFFGYYVNKGGIPYGEHEPTPGHSDNGKMGSCAVMFALMGDKPVETEYYTRLAISSCLGEEYGHTGQGFSYLWTTLGANVGGTNAAAAYLKEVRWHRDLSRRCDGSFVYDGGEQYNAGSTEDDTYWGQSSYAGLNPTASYVLHHAMPLRKLYITGKNASPANWLTDRAVSNAIAAAWFEQVCNRTTTDQLVAALNEYDPTVRAAAAAELGRRTNDWAALAPLLMRMAENRTNANQREAACNALGCLGGTNALPVLGRRLSDPDYWVRARAAQAVQRLGPAALPLLPTMLKVMAANATPLAPINWKDPIQFANGFLADTLFMTEHPSLAGETIKADKKLLYPAIRAGVKQPAGMWRHRMSQFMNLLTFEDVMALMPDIVELTVTTAPADTMFSHFPRAAGIRTLARYHIAEGIPLALAIQVPPIGYGFSDIYQMAGLEALQTYGTAAQWTLPELRKFATTWDHASREYATLTNTIAVLERATNAPALVPGKGKK